MAQGKLTQKRSLALLALAARPRLLLGGAVLALESDERGALAGVRRLLAPHARGALRLAEREELLAAERRLPRGRLPRVERVPPSSADIGRGCGTRRMQHVSIRCEVAERGRGARAARAAAGSDVAMERSSTRRSRSAARSAGGGGGSSWSSRSL